MVVPMAVYDVSSWWALLSDEKDIEIRTRLCNLPYEESYYKNPSNFEGGVVNFDTPISSKKSSEFIQFRIFVEAASAEEAEAQVRDLLIELTLQQIYERFTGYDSVRTHFNIS
jgi:hypothetical protein